MRALGIDRVPTRCTPAGMGVVVAARHLELGELVAIKFLQPHIRESEASCERFKREARTVFRIKNEHVARVFDRFYPAG